jgi:hypothetical protein
MFKGANERRFDMRLAANRPGAGGERGSRKDAAEARPRHPDEVIGLELAQNRQTWAALRRLGVREGTVLPLHFCFESGGPEADRKLASFLQAGGYRVVLGSDVLDGWTPPMVLGLEAIDDWVRTMLYAGYQHGGCAFAGWTATVSGRVRAASEPTPRHRPNVPADGRERQGVS